MPDQISFSGEVEINPNGNTLNYQDFAYETSAIEGNLNMQLPLSFIANDLSLSQETNFNLYKIKINHKTSSIFGVNRALAAPARQPYENLCEPMGTYENL